MLGKNLFSRVPNIITRSQASPAPLNSAHGLGKTPHEFLMWLMERVVQISHGLNWLLKSLLSLPTDLEDWYLTRQ